MKAWLLALVLMLFQGALGVRLEALRPLASAATSAAASRDEAWRYSTNVARALAFGHWPAEVDWLWIRALTDPSLKKVAPGTHAGIYADLDLATDLDPAFLDIYVAGAQVLAVLRNDVTGARDLLLKGEAFRNGSLPGYPESFRSTRWRREWNIPLLLAYVYLFELDDIKSAGVYFTQASRLPGAPAYLQSLARRFEKPGGVYDVAERLLNYMLEAVEGPARERLLEKRESLALGKEVFEVNQRFVEFRAEPSAPRNLQAAWNAFRAKNPSLSKDSQGGAFSLELLSGRIVTATPHPKVFGLE